MEMQRYPGQEKEILDYYQKNQDAIRQLTAPVFEDKVIDFILEKVNLKEVKVTREDLFDSGIKADSKQKEKKNLKQPQRTNLSLKLKQRKQNLKKISNLLF